MSGDKTGKSSSEISRTEGDRHGMRFSDRLTMAVRNLINVPVRTLLLVLVLAFSCGFLFLVYSFYLSFRVQVVDRLLASFPVTQVQVRTPRQVRDTTAEAAEDGTRLTVQSVQPIVEMPQVRDVYYEELLRVASVTTAELGITSVIFESPIYGLSPGFVQPEIEKPETFAHRPADERVPAVISEELLDIFNAAYVMPRGLPALGPEGLRALPMTNAIGRDALGLVENEDPYQCKIRIIGISTRVQPLGLTVPFEYVQSWNRQFMEDYDDRLSRLIVDARTPEGAERVAARAEELGFEARTGRDAIRRIVLIQNIILAAGSLLGGLILSLALVSVGSVMMLSVTEQRQWLGLQRALGARKAGIYLSVILESLLVGALACALGLLAAWLTGGAINDWISGQLPTFATLPGRFFLMDWAVGAWCFAGVCAFAALATLPAARRAVAVTPIEALSG